MKAKHYGVLVTASLALTLTQTQAQAVDEDLSSVFGDNAMVSIATGSQKPLRLAPAVASVITAADIQAMGATDLDQVLEMVPGLHVARIANLYASSYVVRGVYADLNPQILVLRNGVPLTVLITGSKSHVWAGFPLQHIARIEVIRGPGSALYGADAYSGVINIITKNTADLKGSEIGLGGGSFATRDAWFQQGSRWGDVQVAAYVRSGHTDGPKEIIRADLQTTLDDIFCPKPALPPDPSIPPVPPLVSGLRWPLAP